MVSCAYSIRLIEKLTSLDVERRGVLNFDVIKNAIHWAKKYHGAQMRKSGEPFYTHVLEVAYMVSDYSLKTDVIVASILHDIVEDTEVTTGMVLDSFGWRVAEMVDRLTRDRPDKSKLSVEAMLRYAHQKNDREVILIKTMDRLHNIRTMQCLPAEKQKKKIAETVKNFLILAEEFSLSQSGMHLYMECLKLSIELGVVAVSDIKKRESVFDEGSVLPVLAYQNT
jgi:guanosine-3',5'-bis(diphosphate) 3'-pyrophosphohydrolase